MKKSMWFLIIVLLISLITFAVIFKPYLIHEKIMTSDGEVLVQINLITNSMRYYDDITMKWYDKKDYVNLRIKRINEKFEDLYVKDFQTLINILEGKDKERYSFISSSKITEFKIKESLIGISNDGESIISKRVKLIDEFNSLIKSEEEKIINQLKEAMND